MDADVERVVPRDHTRDVLTNLPGIFGEILPIFCRIFGDASEKNRRWIDATSVNNDVLLESAMVGDTSRGTTYLVAAEWDYG